MQQQKLMRLGLAWTHKETYRSGMPLDMMAEKGNVMDVGSLSLSSR